MNAAKASDTPRQLAALAVCGLIQLCGAWLTGCAPATVAPPVAAVADAQAGDGQQLASADAQPDATAGETVETAAGNAELPVAVDAAQSDAKPSDSSADSPAGTGPTATAVVQVQEGTTVLPDTLLHLLGDKSFMTDGSVIGKYLWTVQAPGGNGGVFKPNAAAANPQV